MSVYDPEKTEDKSLTGDNNISDDKLRELMGIHKDEEDAMDRNAHNGAAEDIARREKLGYDGSAHKAGKDEKSLLDSKTTSGSKDEDEGPSLFNDKDNPKKKRFRFKITGKQAAGGVAGVLGLGSIAGILMVSSGPLAFLHMSNLMQNFHFDNNANMTDGRLTKIYRYFRGSSYKNAMGPLGNKLADHYDRKLAAKGIEFDYGRGTGIDRVVLDLSDDDAKKLARSLETDGFTLDTPTDGPNAGKAIIEGETGLGSTKLNRSLHDRIRFHVGEDKIVSAVGGRASGLRFKGGRHPLQNFAREVRQEGWTAFKDSVKAAYEARVKTGEITNVRAPAPTPAEADADALRHIDDNLDDIDLPQADGINASSVDDFTAQLKTRFVTVLGIAGIAEAVCGLQSVGDGIQAIRYRELVVPLMRMGLDGVAMGSQIAVGKDMNAEEMGALFTKFVGETDIGTLSAFASDSIQAELGNEQIGNRTATRGPNRGEQVKPADLPASSKPGRDKPILFKGMDAVIGLIPGSGATCAFFANSCLNFPGQDNLQICASDAFDLIAAALTDGGSVAAAAAWNGAFAAGGLLAAPVIQGIVNWLADAALQCADGPEWGSCINFGGRLAGNDEALSRGGVELSDDQEVALKLERKDQERQDMKTKSMYARYIDPRETNSLFATAVFNNPHFFASATTLSYALQSPIHSFTDIFSNFGNIFGGRTKAATLDDIYGFPEFGYSIEDQNNPDFADPFVNADKVEKYGLDRLNDKYGKCFSTKVTLSSDNTPHLTFSDAVDYAKLDDNDHKKCRDDKDQEMFKRFRFFLADSITLKSQACYDGLDESACGELGFSDTANSNGASTTAAGAEIVGDPFETSVDVDCAEGTTDLGVHSAFNQGNEVMHRLCAVDNLPQDDEESTPGSAYYIEGADGKAIVNSRVSGAVKAMVEAASEAGIELRADSSFRTAEDQQEKWDRNVREGNCSEEDPQPPTCDVARPGFSNHQTATAIDFFITPGSQPSAVANTRTCTDRMTYDSNVWDWLFNNADNYGYNQLSYEAWHWDPSTGPSQCNSNQP